MFYIKEPSTLCAPWILSNFDEEKIVAISKDTTKVLKNYHILGVDFLYQNYRKEFKGAILNEEEGMNMRLQVAAFLNAMFNYVEQKFLILVITPDDSVINWHYHLTEHSGLKAQIITPHTCPADFDQEHGLALLLNFSNLKLAEHLIDYDYFSVVIDNFDEIASKLIVRKLYGDFNIGLTQRNFYINPNQKLQWTMLNWSNPGCVGKLTDFYEIDNDNFADFRDNYRYWWFCLTWNFCDTFQKLTDDENVEYATVISKWALTHHIKKPHHVKAENKIKKRKKLEIIEDIPGKIEGEPKIKGKKLSGLTSVERNENKNLDISYSNEAKHADGFMTPPKIDEESSNDTIIYEDTDPQKKERDPNYVELPSMDENPILNSIIRNFETSEPVTMHHSSYSYNSIKYDLEQPTCSKALHNDDNILLSIINDTASNSTQPILDHETEISYKKEQLVSQIFDDDPCIPKSLPKEVDYNFFESLVESKSIIKVKKGSSLKKIETDNTDDILKETEVLLK